MNKMSPIRKRFQAVALSALCVVLVVTLVGLYKFYRFTHQIYEPHTAQTSQPHDRKDRASGRTHTLTAEHQPPADLSAERSDERLSDRSERQQAPSILKRKTITHEMAAPVDPRSELPVPRQSGAGKTFLLLGVDSRQGEAARADSIVLATLPPGGGHVHLMSIPRDTYVQVAGHGYTKINHAMSYGGLPLMKRTVERFLNVAIDHTVTVDFDGFRELIDELGGLDNVVVEKTMNYDDPTDGTHIHLHKGQTLANGKQALDYARFRHDVEADTGRMRRQQQVIRAMIQKGSEPQSWKHLFQMLDIVGDHVKTDLPPSEWMHLIMTYAYTQPDQVQTMTIKGENAISPDDHLWYFYVKEADRLEASRKLLAIKRGNES